MHALIASHQSTIAALCRQYGVARLEVFGSAARGDFDPQHSDVDLIVTFVDPTAPGIAARYFELVEALEQVLGRPVDLMVDQPITNPYFAASVAETREVVFEQPVQEVAG